MHEAVKLLPPQVTNQAGIGEALDVRIEIAGKKTPDEGQAPNYPWPLRHAKEAPGDDEQGMAADGIGAPAPDDPSLNGAQGLPLQAVVNDGYPWIAQGDPAMVTGAGFIQNVPAVHCLQAAEVLKTLAAVKLIRPGNVMRGIPLGNQLVTHFQPGGAAGQPHPGIVKEAEDAGEAFRPEFQIAVEFGNNIVRFIHQAIQAEIKGIDHPWPQLPLASPWPAQEPDPGVFLHILCHQGRGRIPAAVIHNEPEVRPPRLPHPGVQRQLDELRLVPTGADDYQSLVYFPVPPLSTCVAVYLRKRFRLRWRLAAALEDVFQDYRPGPVN